MEEDKAQRCFAVKTDLQEKSVEKDWKKKEKMEEAELTSLSCLRAVVSVVKVTGGEHALLSQETMRAKMDRSVDDQA